MDKPTEEKSAKGKLIAFDKLQVPKMEDKIYSFESAVAVSVLTVPAPTEEEMTKEMPCKFACCWDEKENSIRIRSAASHEN